MKPWKARHGVPGGPGRRSAALEWLERPCPSCGAKEGEACKAANAYGKTRLKPGQSHRSRRPKCPHPDLDVRGNLAFCWGCKKTFDYQAWRDEVEVWSSSRGFNPKHPLVKAGNPFGTEAGRDD